MITSVILNSCIDRTVELKNLEIGGHNRADQVKNDIGGKGINVSVVLKHLGLQAACIGFEFTRGGNHVGDFLSRMDIPFTSVAVDHEMRMNIKLTDTVRHQMTEVNERGAEVPQEAVQTVLSRLDELLPQTDILVADGSVPAGVPADTYRKMIEKANARGIPSVLDAAGDLFREGIKAGPWMVKPNTFELETYFDTKTSSWAEAVALAKRLLQEGAQNVCLSMGGEGAALITKDGIWYSAGSPIQIQAFQGAGDSMVAGLCLAQRQALPAEEMLRCGVAAAQASLVLPGTELCTRAGFEEMLKTVSVHRIE